MKIALVHDHLNTWGGGERVLEYFSEIWPEAPIYALTYDPEKLAGRYPNRKIITSFIQKLPGMPKNYKWYLALMPKAIESFDMSEFDVVLSDSSAYAKGVITKKPTVHVCYLHTPTRYLTSDRQSYLEYAPIPAPIRPIMPPFLAYLRNWDLKASKRPNYLIANSHYIAERTKTYYHRTPEAVIFPPVDTKLFTIAPKIGDFWLTVARQEPYKRTDLAIKAANQLDLKLKIVGTGRLIDQFKVIAGPTVEFLGRVSDKELAELYSQAIGFIFPPKEDAGMTPLESMASGRPVIAYGEGGALESVVAGKTGEFFPEQTVESLVNVLKNFQPEKYDPQVIRAHAKLFDVEIFKAKIKTIVEQQYAIGHKD
jgi:glycosyltransferase involved in cell wall biosynthesis